MRKQFLIFSSVTIALISCQKEVDLAPGGGSGGGGTTPQKLIRTGTRSGADTTTTEFGYNAAGKINRQYVSGTVQGTTFFLESKFNRNASGIITSIVIKSDQLAPLGIDSIVTRVNYNTGTSRYTSSVTSLTLFGFTIRDSSAYSYDGSGRITQDESFSSDPLTGVYEKTSKDVFTYLTGSNVGNEKFYDWDDVSSSYILSEEYTNTYDAKVNPLTVGMEAIFLGNMVFAAGNNLTKAVYVDATDPSNNETTDILYSYNIANKPVSGISTATPGGAVTNVTYIYQ